MARICSIVALVVIILFVLLVASTMTMAQMVLSEPASEKSNTAPSKRFVSIMGGMYGYAYPAGSIYTSDNYVKREKGKYFGATHSIGYELSPNFIMYGGFTLWDAEVFVTRHLFMRDLKTRYSMDTCSLHMGIMFVYKWFFADVNVYTELPLKKDSENVYLAGKYVQTNTLKERYEYGGFMGLGVRIPVIDEVSILAGIYGGGGFVPSIESTKGDLLYIINGTMRISVIVYFL